MRTATAWDNFQRAASVTLLRKSTCDTFEELKYAHAKRRRDEVQCQSHCRLVQFRSASAPHGVADICTRG